MSDLIQRALQFATQAHGRIDQRRKYSHQPYEAHLKAAAALVAECGVDDPARQGKALQLQSASGANCQQGSLLDWLQLSDKLQLTMADLRLMTQLGFDTKGKARRVAQEIEALRNNLAHAQDIVSYDRPQIARLARRIDRLAEGGGLGD